MVANFFLMILIDSVKTVALIDIRQLHILHSRMELQKERT